MLKSEIELNTNIFNRQPWSLPGNDRVYQVANLTSVIMKKSSPGSPCTTIFSPSSNWTGSRASATVSRSHLSRDSKILKIIKLYYKNTPTLAEDSYLNWQLCRAWFCYKRNISFIQALCTNLQLGNMNVFIHCVLAISNHPDSNLKSWTGEAGSGFPCLWSDLHCPGAATAWSSWGAARRCGSTWDSLSTSQTSPAVLPSELFPVPAGWCRVHLKGGWDLQSQWPDLDTRAGHQRHPWMFEMAPLHLPAGCMQSVFIFPLKGVKL